MSFVRLSQRLSVKHICLAHVFHKSLMKIMFLGPPSGCFRPLPAASWLPLVAASCVWPLLAASWLLLGCSWLLPAILGCSKLLLAVPGCSWLCRAASQLLLVALGCCQLLWRLLGCCWAILDLSSVKTMVLFAFL